MTNWIASIKKHNDNPNGFRKTNAHLIRLGVCITPNLIPCLLEWKKELTLFYKHIKPNLNPKKVFHTAKYGGADTFEEYVFTETSKIILGNKAPSLCHCKIILIININYDFNDARHGFEPWLKASKASVLPLDDRAIC